MVLTAIIAKYLQTNRRITVPALGTFLSKGANEPTLFSEFMKTDDGVLRELLSTEYNMSELEAAIFIDRFVFDLRHAVESQGCFAMPYLGYMHSTQSSGFSFEFNPRVPEPNRVERVRVAIPEIDTQTTPIVKTPDKTTVATKVTMATVLDVYAKEDNAALGADTRGESETNAVGQTEDRGDSGVVSRGAKRAVRVDFWIIISIVVLLFAIGAVCYGLIVEWIIGNVSFGSGIDNMLEDIFSSENGIWLEEMLTPESEISSESIIPQDTVIIKVRH